MPHLRPRFLPPLLDQALKVSAVVGILGQRQTGKTTLVERAAAEYSTLDDEESLELALKSAKEFISGRAAPFAIDECQLSPPLFPAIKEWCRVNKKRGQFLLTGSVRFTSVQEIKESLTGRILDLELLPLTLAECHGHDLLDLTQVARATDPISVLSKRPFARSSKLHKAEEFLNLGGLPGICFFRSDLIRSKKMRSHIKTILDRDLRQVIRTELDYLSLKTFLEELAVQQGESLDLTRAARQSRIAINTARKLLSGLESVFLIRVLHRTGTSLGRSIYFEDQGMASFLLKERGIALVSGRPRLSDWTRCLFQQLLAQVKYGQHSHGELTTYATRGGALVDFVVHLDGKRIGLVVGQGTSASASQTKSAQSFLKKHPDARVFLLHLGDTFRRLGPNLFESPLGAFF